MRRSWAFAEGREVPGGGEMGSGLRAAAIAAMLAACGLPGTAAYAQLTITEDGNVTVGIAPAQANLTVTGVIEGFGTVPVGAIIDWYRPDGVNLQLPANFVYCDGSDILDKQSPFDGMKAPDLRHMFVRGAWSSL